MSQQINLLVRKRGGVGFELAALVALGLMLLLLLGYWAAGQRNVGKAQAAETASAQQLQVAQAQLQARVQQSANNTTRDEITSLKQRGEAAQQLLALMNDLGNSQGYGRYFSALGSISEEGLWLTNVTISKSGKVVNLSGRALRQESVMRYAQRLNALFADDGVQFTALEITPEASSGQGSSATLATTAFKLY